MFEEVTPVTASQCLEKSKHIKTETSKEEKKIKNCDEISKLIKAFPKDIAALDKRRLIKIRNAKDSQDMYLTN